MSDQTKTKAQLINELKELRQKVVLLEKEATGHWRKEKSLEKQNSELQLILDSVPAYIFYKDKGGRIIRGNAAVARSAGMPREKWEGRTAFDLLPDLAERYQKDDMEVITTGEPKKGIVEPFETRKGMRWLSTHKLPVKDDNGNVTGLIGFSIDITDHVKDADALRQSEEKLRAVFDSIEEAITVTDMEGNIIDANRAAARNSGFRSKKAIIGKNGLEFVAAKDKVQCARDIKHMAETGQGKTVEYTFVDRRGREYEGWASASLLRDSHGDPTGYVIVAKDVTAQRRMEEALRTSEENYRILAENMKDALYSIDMEGRITYLGPQAVDYDIDPREAISRNMLEFVYPDDRERVLQDFQRTISTGDEFPTEFRITDSKGNIYWVEESGRLQRDESGKVVGITGVLRDVTERKRLEAELKQYGENLEKKVEDRTAALAAANRKLRQEIAWRKRVEKALRESEEMLRTMFESMVEGVLVCDLSGNIAKVNEAALRMAKVTRKALVGRNVFDFIAEEDRSRAAQDLTVTLAAGITKATLEYVFLTGEGDRIDAEFSAALLRDSEGNPAGIIGIARDVTERKQMEQTIKESESRFRELFKHMNSGVAVYEATKDGEDFIFKDCNAAAEKISKLRKRDYIGKSVLKKMPFLKDFGLFEVLQTVWKTGKPVHFPASYYVDERVAGWRDNYVYRLPSGEVVAVYDDVTERMEAERALRESEEKLRTMFETISDALVLVDIEGNIVEVNEAAVYISGYNRTDLVGHSFLEFIEKRDHESLLADMKETLEAGIAPKNLQYSLTGADGRKIEIEFNASVLRGPSGEPSGFVAVVRDVSQRKRMEEALRESEEKRRIIFESIEDAITVTDINGRILDLNRAAIKTFGVGSKKKAIGMEGFNFIAEKDRQRAMEDMVKLFTGRWRGPEEYTFQTFDGREFIAESSNAVLRDASGEMTGFVSINRDVTERKRMEQALRDSEEKLRIIFDSISDGIAVTDLDIKIVQANEAVTRMAGYKKREQLLGRSALEWIAPEDLEKAMIPMAEAVKGHPLERGEFRIRPPKGVEFLGEIGISPVRDSDGNMTGFVTVIRDVTERKRMEESLRQSEEKLRTIFETIPDGVTITDMEGRIVEENPAAVRMSGYSSKEEVIGHSGFDFMVEEDRAGAIEDMSVLYETGLGVPGVYRMRTADGREYYAEIISAMMRGDGGEPSGIVAVIRDVTERRRAEEMLRQSEEKYRSLVDQMQEGYLIVRGQHIIFANERCADFLGIPVEKIVGQSIWDFVLPEDVQKAEALADSFVAARGGLHLMEFGYYREDGRMVPLEINLKGIEYEGKPVLSVVLRDVTERKQMENELRASEEKLRTMFDMMRDGVVLVDTQGKIVDVNEAILRIGGHKSREQLIGRDGFELVAGEDRDRLLKAVTDSLSGKFTTDRWEARFARGDGGFFDAELSGSLIRDSLGNPQAFIGVIRDITERRRMEEALRASEEKLRFMFESIADGILSVDLEGKITEVNEAIVRMGGFDSKDEMIGLNAFDFVAERDRQRALEENIRNVTEGRGSMVRYAAVGKGGKEFMAESVGSMLRDSGGNPIGFITVVRDVTERQRMEQELHRIRIAVEGSSDAIGMSDPQGNHFYQNRSFTELFEYTAEDLRSAGGGPAAYADREVAREVFDTIMGGGSWIGEVEMVSRSGRRFPVLLRADAIKDDAGRIIGLIGMHTDITERKRAEAALRESEEKLRAIFETSPDFIMSIDRDGKLLFINRTVPEMTIEQAIGTCAYDYIIPEAREKFIRSIGRVFKTGKAATIETSGLGPDGRTSYYETRFSPVTRDGIVLSVTAVATDITERRRAEEALRESEERYRALVEGAGTPITTFDTEGNILVINETSANYFGGKAKDFIGKTFRSLFPDAADALLERNRRIVETGVSEVHEDFLTLPAGNRWFLSSLQPVAHPNGEIYAVQVISQDITDRKNIERALRDSEEKLRFMFESMGDAIVVVDAEGRITEVNEKLIAMSGYTSREEVLGRNAFEFVSEKDRAKAMEDFARNLERQVSATIEYVSVDRYGREFDVEANGAMLRDSEGNTVGFIIALRDISERKMMEQKLRDSEEMARGMLESAAAGIYMVQNGRFEYVSPQFEQISGYEAVDLLGTEALSYVHPDDRGSVRQKAIEGLKGKSSLPYEFRFVRKDGSTAWVLEKVASIQYKSKRATIASLMDVTERKRAEQALVASEEKLRSFMDSATDYFTIWDSELRLVDLNAAAMRYPVVEIPAGWDKQHFIGKSMAQLDPSTKETGRYDQYLQVIKTAKPFFAEDIVPHTKLGDVHMAISAFKVGEGLGIITSDVTERRRAEKELRERKEELERRTNQLLALQKVTASIQSTLELGEVLQQVAEGVVDNLGYDQSLVLVVDEKSDVYRARAWYSKDRVLYREGVERILALALTDVKFPRKRGYSMGVDESMDGKVVITHSFSAVAVPPLDKKQAGAVQEFLGARTIVSVPLFAMERHVGGIIAFTHKDDVAETDVEPLRLLADQAGVAIVNANIYEGAAELAQRLAVTGTLSRILGSSLDINEVYQAFTDEIRNVIDFERANVSLVEGDHLRLHVLAPAEERTVGDGLVVPLAESVTETIIRGKQTDIESDLSLDGKSPMDLFYAEKGLRSVIRVPLLSKGEVFGSFELVSRKSNAYGEREQGILEQVAGSMAAAVENSRLFAQVKQHEAELIKAYEELKAAQDYMLQVEKLRALGEMASGVAHDFNNVLAIVLGRAQLALEDVKDAKLKKDLQIIEQAALDAASTVRRLQDFSRVRVDRTFEPVDLNKVVEGTLQMVDSRRIELKETQGVSIDVITDLDKLPTILGNASELREALVNIVFNAMDAMPRGGTITVKSAIEERWAVLSISDTGVGIPEEIIGKIFDPFFTTRAPKGSGLGLSVTYGIITRHGGKIDVESAVGKGTTFYIKLPAAGAVVGTQPPGKVSASVKPAHILLVDDDPEVGEVLGLMLRQMGHKVTGVDSGGAAVKAFESGGYDLVITDLGIPDMSGHEVAAAVKRISPRTPVVMITGWGVQLDLKEMPEIDGLVAKPFSKQALLEKISKLLESKPHKGDGRKKKKGPV